MRFWLALTETVSPTLEQESGPTEFSELGSPTEEDKVSLEWRHEALGFIEAIQTVNEFFPPTLKRRVLTRITDISRKAALESLGTALISDLEAGRSVWDTERLAKCYFWHALAVSRSIEDLQESTPKRDKAQAGSSKGSSKADMKEKRMLALKRMQQSSKAAEKANQALRKAKQKAGMFSIKDKG